MKKVFCFMLACLLVLAGVPAAAEGTVEKEFIKNGTFEYGKDGVLSAWSVSGGKWGDVFTASEDAFEGKYALCIKTDGNAYVSQSLESGMIPGKSYTLTGQLKTETANTDTAIKFEFYGANGYIEVKPEPIRHFKLSHRNKWTKVEYKFTVPQGTTRIGIMIRVLGGGTAYWDNISIFGQSTEAAETHDWALLNTTVVPNAIVSTEEKEDKEYTVVEGEFVINGGFETVSGDKPSGWAVSGGKWGEEFTFSTDAHSGKNALRISTDGNAFAAQKLTGLVPGTSYALTAQMRPNAAASHNYAIKLEFYGDGKFIKVEPEPITYYDTRKRNAYIEVAFPFTAPEGADSVNVMLRVLGGGDVCWDDVTMQGPRKVEVPKQNFTIKELPEGAENLIPEGTFEAATEGGVIPGATTYKNDTTDAVRATLDAERGMVVRETDSTKSKNPWVCFKVTPVEPDAEYQVQAYLRTVSLDGYVAFKIEFYDADGKHHFASADSTRFAATLGSWMEVGDQFRAPVGASYMLVYARLYGNGEIYWDDVACYRSEAAPYISLISDYVYYTDETIGAVTVPVNTVSYELDTAAHITFTLSDGETVLHTDRAAAAETVRFSFPLSLLTEKGKDYLVRACYLDAAGEEQTVCEDAVVVYDRPSCLTKDGFFVKKDGTIVHPVIGYHVKLEAYAKAAAMGVNVVQCRVLSNDVDAVCKYLDEAEKYGMLVFVPLYPNMKPAAHPDNIEKTVACIERIKNHPALFGYMVMDEPFLAGRGINHDEMAQWMRDSYKLIREHDAEHVIYACEADTSDYQEVASTVDVLAIDPYIGLAVDKIGTTVSNKTVMAMNAVSARKPVYTIVQAWHGEQYYEPSANDVRSFLYQALFAGADGLGYYRICDFGGKDEDGKDIWEYELFDGITCFNEREFDDAVKAFITGEYPTFAQNTAEDSNIWYKLYVKDGALYAVLLNRYGTQNTVNIPLVSLDGTVTVGQFTAEADDISGAPALSGTDTLTAVLSENQIVRYKLTVSEDLSGLTMSKYRDTVSHGWAKRQIDTLAAKQIVNDTGLRTFSPGLSITRGDFELFFIRTLGLTSDETESFTDVPASAEYAKEIAAGKAHGILNGIGDGLYAPESTITRQDMMTIIARGMQLSGEADMSGYPDAALVADYALPHVRAMIASGLIKGNADGTLNPLGTTTRAEAAVIMDRILQNQA